MPDSAFYRQILERDLTPEVRSLMQSLLFRADRIGALEIELPDRFAENRARREGKPFVLSKSAKRTIRAFEKDSEKAAKEVQVLLASIQSESRLAHIALMCERNDLEMCRAVYTGGHPEDEIIARPLLEWREANIAELEAFVSRPAEQESAPNPDP